MMQHFSRNILKIVQMSVQVIRDLVHVLHEEYETYGATTSTASLRILRSGHALLHTLALGDKAFTARCLDFHDEYIPLIYFVGKLFQSIPEIDKHEGRFTRVALQYTLFAVLTSVLTATAGLVVYKF